MEIPFSAPKRQFLSLKTDINQAIVNVLESGWYVLGKNTQEFEKAFATYCQVRHCVGVANGTDALEIALRAVGCGDSDEVITVTNAGGYTTSALHLIGAVPVYVDIDSISLLMDIYAAVRAVTKKTKCIVVTHLYGQMVNVPLLRKSLMENVENCNVSIIEDCAQAHGAMLNNYRAGSMGDAAAFSFYSTKNLAAIGDAGAIVTNDDEIACAARKLHQYGWGEKYKIEQPYGRNSRMDEIQAAILKTKLPYLNEWNTRRREIVARYREVAPKEMKIIGNDDKSYVGHLCIARHPERNKIRKQLRDFGITTDIHYPILDVDQEDQANLPAISYDLSESRKAVREILSLPCFPEMTEAEVQHVKTSLTNLEI